MELLVNRSQVFAVDVRVDLRGRDVDVAQHLLHGPEIRAAFQQMCRERMAQRVGRHRFRDSNLGRVLAKDLPRAHARQRLSSGVEEQDSLSLALLQLWTELAQIDRDCADRAAADRNQALLGAFAEYAHQVVLKHHVANAERNPFRNPESGTIGKLQHRPVAKRQGLVERRSSEKLLDLFNAEHFRKRAPLLRRFQSLACIAHHVSLAEHELEVCPNGRDIPPDRCWSESEVLEMVYEFAEQARSNLSWRRRAFYARVGDESGDVALVRVACLYRGTLFESEEIVEPLDVKGAGHGIIQRGLTHVFLPAASIAKSPPRGGRSQSRSAPRPYPSARDSVQRHPSCPLRGMQET